MMDKIKNWYRRKDGKAIEGEYRQLGLHLIQTGVVAVIANAALETYLGKPGYFPLLVAGSS